MARLKRPEIVGNAEAPASSELSALEEDDKGAACSRSTTLTRAASFSVSRINLPQHPSPTQHYDPHRLQPPDFIWTTAIRDKAGFGGKNGMHLDNSNDGKGDRSDYQPGSRSIAPSGYRASPGGEGMNSEGFPLLYRRRTFSQPTTITSSQPTATTSRGSSPITEGGEVVDNGQSAGSGSSVSGGGSGRIPMSVSEDNMMHNFFSKHASSVHRPRHPPHTPPTTPREMTSTGGSNSSISYGSSGEASSDDEGSLLRADEELEGRQPQQQQQQQQKPWQPTRPALDLARRNAFVMRLHRKGLIEDMCRCVMDVAKGRAAAEAATAAATIGRGEANSKRVAVATPTAVTLQEVKAHLLSLPERYALSVEPEDVLAHMALLGLVKTDADASAAAITATSAGGPPPAAAAAAAAANGGSPRAFPTVRIVARRSRSHLSSRQSLPDGTEIPPQSGGAVRGGDGDGSDDGNEKKRRERYAVTVACVQNPLLLGAVSSSLQSAGATCLEADVATTTKATRGPEVSLVRLEVELVGEFDVCSNPTRAAAPAPAPAPAPVPAAALGWRGGGGGGGGVGGLTLPQPLNPSTPEQGDPAPLLAEVLSSAITAFFETGKGKEYQQHQHQHQQHEGRQRKTGREREYGCGGRVGDGGRSPRFGDHHQGYSGEVDAQGRLAVAARAGQSSRRRQEEETYRGDASLAGTLGVTTDAATTGGGGSSSSRSHLRERRTNSPTRRQGSFCLAEADTNDLDGNGKGDGDPFSFGGGGGSSDIYTSKTLSSSDNDYVFSFDRNDSVSINNNNNNNNNSQNNNFGFNGHEDMADDSLEIPREEINLLEIVGKGRFSRTYRAKWRGTMVAVKTLELPLPPPLPPPPPPPSSGGRRWRGHDIAAAQAADGRSDKSVVVAEFERELQIVRNLKHPNVCAFRGVCVASPPLHQLALVYDFLANGTLGDRLMRGGGGVNGLPNAANRKDDVGCGQESRRGRPPGRLGSDDLMRIIKDVVDGMLYVHEVGVLHRDLKPDNILLDENDRAVIADFGLSCLCHPSNEHTAETGTYRWMAPEVIRHEPYGKAADVYSFGIVLWQVITRRRPFEGLTPIQAAFSVARQGLRPRLPASAPPALSSLVRRCWHRSPGARPSFPQIRSELPEIERQMLSR